jgi:hypothetical protein
MSGECRADGAISGCGCWRAALRSRRARPDQVPGCRAPRLAGEGCQLIELLACRSVPPDPPSFSGELRVCRFRSEAERAQPTILRLHDECWLPPATSTAARGCRADRCGSCGDDPAARRAAATSWLQPRPGACGERTTATHTTAEGLECANSDVALGAARSRLRAAARPGGSTACATGSRLLRTVTRRDRSQRSPDSSRGFSASWSGSPGTASPTPPPFSRTTCSV